MDRDPRKDPKPGDVLLPKSGFKMPCLVTSIVDVMHWHSVYCCQPFCEKIMQVSFDKWDEWMSDAEVLHAAD